MNFPPFNDPWGKNRAASERPPVKAPADLNWDAIEAKIRQRKQPVSTGEPRYDSSGYLGRMRQEDPWPTKDERNSDCVSLINCRFLTPTEDLLPDHPCTVACDVKSLQTSTSRDVLFRLQSRLADSDPWTDSNETSTAALKTDLPSQTVQAKLTLYCPMPAPELGTMLHFRVIAEHTEAAANSESPDTPVQLRNLCYYVGAPEIVFPNDGECPTLDESGGLVHGLAAVVKQLSLPQPMGSDTVVVFGFASSSGSDAHNRDLSLRRAQVLKALLGRDADSWGDLAKANFTITDIQQILSGLTTAFGWPCDPGEVDGEDGPKTQGAVKAFQTECNSRYSLGLKPDGVCGPKTWKAVHRAICAEVSNALGQDPSAEPSWPEIPWGYAEGKGVYACGEDFSSSDDGAADRHAEICVFGSNMEPPLTAPAPGAKVTIAQDPVEDPEKIKKVRLTIGSAPAAPSSGDPCLPLFERHYHDNYFMPKLLDDEFMEVMAGLADYHKANGTCPVDIHPDAPSNARDLLDKRKGMAESIVHNDTDAWQNLTETAALADVQNFLKYFASKGWPCDPGAVDGVDGPKTKEAVRDFQCLCNEAWGLSLKMDGIFGPKTWQGALRALRELIEPESASTPHSPAKRG